MNPADQTAINHARANLEHRSSIRRVSSEKGCAMNNVIGSFAKIFAVGFALTLASCGQAPAVVDPVAQEPAAQESTVPAASQATLQALGRRTFDCTSAQGMSYSECRALVSLYNTTNGAAWTNNTKWLKANDPCTWYGVGCINGHVLLLNLPNNNLSGHYEPQLQNLTQLNTLVLGNNKLTGEIPTELGNLKNLESLDLHGNLFQGSIPITIGSLSKMQTLWLQSNQLRGSIPAQLANLSKLKFLHLEYNMLSSNPNLNTFLASKQPDWAATQTVPPSNVQGYAISSTTTTLWWNPVAYTADGGYYDILMMPVGGSTFKSVGQTANKSSSTFDVTGLTPGRYSFVLRTITPKHGEQKSDLSSDGSDPMVPNRAPVAVDDSYSLVQNTTLSVDAAHGLFANDSDPDGDPIKLGAYSLKTPGGKFNVGRDGAFNFTPAPGFVGTATATYAITDGRLPGNNSGTVTFQVTAPASGSLMAFVYQDGNVNHEFDSYEQMLSGWQVTLKNTLTGQSQVLTSDARGSASFTNVTPGSYSVCEKVMPGWTSTALGSSEGCYTANVVSNQNSSFWFGNTTSF